VNPTEHTAKTLSPKTGPFAALRALFAFSGCGASSPRRRLTPAILATLCTFVGLLALPSAPALAAFTYPFERELKPSGGSFGFLDAGSVAVNDLNGKTYVGDSVSGVVDVFETASVTELPAWTGSAVTNPPGTPAGSFGAGAVSVAANNTTGQVYVLDSTDSVVDVFDATGKYQCQITGTVIPSASECNPLGSATPAGGFSTPLGITVDQANGDVYVVDASNSVIDVFSAGGEYLKQISLLSIPSGFNTTYTRGIGVDDFNGHVYVSDSGQPRVYEFNATGNYLTTWNGGECQAGSAHAGEPEACKTPAGSFGQAFLSVAADNATGRVYVTDTQDHVTDVFDASGAYLTQFGHSFVESRGTAVDQATHGVDVSVNAPGRVDVFGARVVPDVLTEAPSGLKPVSVTLNGKVNPDGLPVTDCRFDYGTTTAYGQTAECVPAAGSIPADSTAHPVSAAVSLEPDTTYHYRLEASNANGSNTDEPPKDVEFTTPGPGIHSQSASNVASSSAKLEGSIDPHGAATSYHFEYDTVPYAPEEGAHGLSIPVPDATVGSGHGDVEVTQEITGGLSPGTLYHYRLVATSELEGGPQQFDGPDQTFTTQTTGARVLPDGRQWELVSPPDKHGALLLNAHGDKEEATQAAGSGGAVVYLASGPVEPEPQGNANLTQVLATRGSQGWSSRGLEIPHKDSTGKGSGAGSEYRFFSGDLSLAALQPFGTFDPLSPQATEQTPYLRTDYTSAGPSNPCRESCFRPLVTSAPGFADVPPGTAFGEEDHCHFKITCGPLLLAGTPDLKHVVITTGVPLTSTGGSLYEWSATSPPGQALQSLGVLPANEGGGTVEATLGNFEHPTDARRASAVSDDGSRVLWSALAAGHAALYLRESVKGETVRLDVPEAGVAPGEPKPRFQLASSDASRVLFTDTQRLTSDSGAEGTEAGAADLYQCEIIEAPGGLECRLSDLTPSVSGEHAGVQGAVIGASRDASWVYFVADGALAPGAQSGQPNLYVHHGTTTKLIAVLSPQDHPDWTLNSDTGGTYHMSARVSPDGGWLAFMSQRPLTGYDSRDLVSGLRDEEVFLFDAGSGRVICASCDPTGGRPVGTAFRDGAGPGAEASDEAFLGGNGAWSSGVVALAALVPGWPTPNYQTRYLSDGGRVFFESQDGLVPRDVNGTWDVYEFEPFGVGGCSAGGAGLTEVPGGCVGLISSGVSAAPAAFVDASESGGDVFFLTAGKLSPADFDTSLDLYDAHECTAGAPCLAAGGEVPPPCDTGASCKASPSPQPPIFGSPASATFPGAGNVPSPLPPPPVTRHQRLVKALQACRKLHRRHRRVVCEHQARKRYGPAKTKKASHATTTHRKGK
jgi:DNA-binding beta-propeller fold protein YncE